MQRAVVLAALAAACKGKRDAPSAGSGSQSAGSGSAGSGALSGSGSSANAVSQTPDARGSGDEKAPAQPKRNERVVWKLVDNRSLAHRQLDGDLVVDAREPSFVRYAGFAQQKTGWKIGGGNAGAPNGANQQTLGSGAQPERTASLALPLASHQLAAKTLFIHIFAKAGAKVNFAWNGATIAKTILIDGWQTLALPLHPNSATLGDNMLSLTTSAKEPVSIDWLRVGNDDRNDSDPAKGVAFVAADNKIQFARTGAGLAWYVAIPEGANLIGDVGGGESCAVDVKASASDGSFVGGRLMGKGARVDLTKMAGQAVRLELTAADCESPSLSNAAITLHGDPPVLPKAAPPKYIVLWVMDAMRADRIPTFTPGARTQTPTFDELAKTGSIFRQYYVQGNESQTSHSSVWTSLYPAVHNVRMAGVGGVYRVNNKFPILGDELAKAGLVTSGTTGNGFVNADNGYARGFKEYRNMMREKGVINGVIYGQQIVDAVIKRFDALRENPAFIFLGTIDTHGPWIARKPWIDIYSPDPYNGPFQEFGTAKDLGFRPGSMGCAIIPPPKDVERLRAIYDSAVSYSDRELGRFVKQLKDWGIWDQTMLMVTADHGEELFEDRRCGHGGSLRDVLTRVPLLVHYPALFPGGIVDDGAEGVDILPTMLAALGQPLFDTAQGRSLIEVANGATKGWPTPSYASMYEYAHAMRIGRWKMRVPHRGSPILHDFVEDPSELKDFSTTKPFEGRLVTDAMTLFLATRTHWQKSKWGVANALTSEGAAALDSVESLNRAWQLK